MVFPSGLKHTLFGSYFISTLFISINGVISICFNSYIITIKKVTRLRVRLFKSTIKSIFMFFLWLERNTPFLDLFYFKIDYYYQWCHLNRFQEFSDYYQKSNKTYSKNFQINKKVNLHNVFPSGLRETRFFGLILLHHC